MFLLRAPALLFRHQIGKAITKTIETLCAEALPGPPKYPKLPLSRNQRHTCDGLTYFWGPGSPLVPNSRGAAYSQSP